MFEIITDATLDEYESFIRSHPKGHFLQSSLWAPVKPSWKWQAVAVRSPDGRISGAMSVLIRKVPGLPYTLMYSARGPVCDPHDRHTLEALTAAAHELARRHKCYALKLDPDISSADSEFISTMKDLGYAHTPGDKDFNGVQPNYVFRLDVQGKTEDELLAAFHSKTRYNLRLAERKGVSVRVCGPEMLDDFSHIMNATGARDGFIVRGRQYFETLLASLGEHARLYMAIWEDKPIAGSIAIWFGDKVWYLYGASANEYRNVMPNYLLQWEMIRWSLEKGCKTYDFRGVSGDLTPENPLYGLYLFKKGFSGELCEFCGELEMVYRPGVNLFATKGVDTLRRLRHSLRRKSGASAK